VIEMFGTFEQYSPSYSVARVVAACKHVSMKSGSRGKEYNEKSSNGTGC
jgi:hypothetical protein